MAKRKNSSRAVKSATSRSVDYPQTGAAPAAGHSASVMSGGVLRENISEHLKARSKPLLSRRVELRPDNAWREQLPTTQKLLVASLCWPLMRRHGYLGRTSKFVERPIS